MPTGDFPLNIDTYLYNQGLISKSSYKAKVLKYDPIISNYKDEFQRYIKCPKCSHKAEVIDYRVDLNGCDMYTIGNAEPIKSVDQTDTIIKYECSQCYTVIDISFHGLVPKKYKWDSEEFEKLSEEDIDAL